MASKILTAKVSFFSLRSSPLTVTVTVLVVSPGAKSERCRWASPVVGGRGGAHVDGVVLDGHRNGRRLGESHLDVAAGGTGVALHQGEVGDR